MKNRQRTRAQVVAKPDLVSTTLVYPMSMTTGAGNLDTLLITGNQSAPISQQVFQVQDSSANARFSVGVAGGAFSIGKDIRAYNPAGTAYVALSGRSNPSCIEFPDGTSAQGSKLWGGTGAPSSTTVGTAATGDYYMRRAGAVAATLVAASYTTSTAQASISVGSGTLTANTTKSLDGVPVAGDLLIFVCLNAEATVTATIGSDSAVAASGTDGGLDVNDGTRHVRMFSHVIQSGDISSSQVTCTPSAHATGAGRKLACYIFRHGGGFATTGSKHGCALVTSGSDTSGSTSFTITTGAASTYAPIEVAANFASGSVNTTYIFDGGSSSNSSNEVGGSANGTTAARPGLGTNTSGATGSASGLTAAVAYATTGATHAAAVGVWQPQAATINATDPWLYVCTTAGSPGTWSQVI